MKSIYNKYIHHTRNILKLYEKVCIIMNFL